MENIKEDNNEHKSKKTKAKIKAKNNGSRIDYNINSCTYYIRWRCDFKYLIIPTGRTDEMEEALIKHCKGTEFFVNNIMDKTQAQIFDYLSEVVRYEMESPFTEKKKTTKKSSKAI